MVNDNRESRTLDTALARIGEPARPGALVTPAGRISK